MSTFGGLVLDTSQVMSPPYLYSPLPLPVSWPASDKTHPHLVSPIGVYQLPGLLQKGTGGWPSVPRLPFSRASFHVGYYVPPFVRQGDPFGGLKHVWIQYFEFLFSNLPNMWSFGPLESPRPVGWFVFKDIAKVRFFCQRCSHGWTSMRGLVVFYYSWDDATKQGHVRFSLTGQKCGQCTITRFETPMWYPEETQKVLTNLYHEVGGRVYQLQTPPLIKVRRHGRPRNHHNSQMCEGCFQGLCMSAKTPSTQSYVITERKISANHRM